jgi:plasmid stabilization system protein ParE
VTRRFTLWPDAESDLEEIRDWLISEAGSRVAICVIGALPKAIGLLASRPAPGHTRKDLTDLLLKFWPVFSCFIVYDGPRRPIEIVRVFTG